MKLTEAINTGSISSAHVSNVIFEPLAVSCIIPVYVRKDNGVQFTIKLFAILNTLLVANHLTATLSHLQTNKRVKLHNCMKVTRLKRYVAENKKYWDLYIQPLTSEKNVMLRNSKETTPFRFVLLRHPSAPTVVSELNVLTSDNCVDTDPQWLRLNLQRKITALQSKAFFQMRRQAAQHKPHYHSRDQT